MHSSVLMYTDTYVDHGYLVLVLLFVMRLLTWRFMYLNRFTNSFMDTFFFSFFSEWFVIILLLSHKTEV